jgi:hypothetical protein
MVWMVPRGTASDHAAEQDKAAGGRHRRLVQLSSGRQARASIALKHLPKTRKVYAYLRYSVDGKTVTKYVGDVTAETRKKALRRAWQVAHDKELCQE